MNAGALLNIAVGSTLRWRWRKSSRAAATHLISSTHRACAHGAALANINTARTQQRGYTLPLYLRRLFLLPRARICTYAPAGASRIAAQSSRCAAHGCAWRISSVRAARSNTRHRGAAGVIALIKAYHRAVVAKSETDAAMTCWRHQA